MDIKICDVCRKYFDSEKSGIGYKEKIIAEQLQSYKDTIKEFEVYHNKMMDCTENMQAAYWRWFLSVHKKYRYMTKRHRPGWMEDLERAIVNMLHKNDETGSLLRK